MSNRSVDTGRTRNPQSSGLTPLLGPIAEDVMTAENQSGPRLCGRCRRPLDDDPTLEFQHDWVLCPACAEVLLPGKPTSFASP